MYVIPFYGKRRPKLADLVLDYNNESPDEYDEWGRSDWIWNELYNNLKRHEDGSLSEEDFLPNMGGGEDFFCSEVQSHFTILKAMPPMPLNLGMTRI